MRSLENRSLERMVHTQKVFDGVRPISGQSMLSRANRVQHPLRQEERVYHSLSCEKWGHTISELRRVCMLENPFSRLSEMRENTFIAVSCTDCGHTEFYSASVLEEKGHAHLLLEEWMD